MTYCGAEISYAVYLVMAGETVSFCDVWISSWYHTDFHVTVPLNEQKEKHCLFHHIFFPVSLFFSCLEKQNKQALTDDPLLPIYSLPVRQPEPCFFQNLWEYANEGASHSIVEWVVTRAEGSKGTQGGGGGGGSTTTDEGGSPHLPPSAVRASSSLHNGNSPIVFFFFFS